MDQIHMLFNVPEEKKKTLLITVKKGVWFGGF